MANEKAEAKENGVGGGAPLDDEKPPMVSSAASGDENFRSSELPVK